MRFVRMLLVGALLLGTLAPAAYAADPDLEAEIAAASTPAQHEALAQQYHAKAADARAAAERHRGMAKVYQSGKSVMSQAPHCTSLARRYDENAADYDALAATHEQLAKQ